MRTGTGWRLGKLAGSAGGIRSTVLSLFAPTILRIIKGEFQYSIVIPPVILKTMDEVVAYLFHLELENADGLFLENVEFEEERKAS